MIDRTAVADWITKQVACRLGLDPRTIDLDKPFAEYGLIQWRRWNWYRH